MIFVTVGTQDKPFTRLIKIVEQAVLNGEIKDEVIVQAGNTKYESEVLNILNYIPFDQFDHYLKKADVIITHGGVGSILNAIKIKKKVIAVPRLFKYNEHINDHQLQIIKKMSEAGYILSLDENESLKDKLEEIKNFNVKEYQSNTKNFITAFNNILKEI